MHRISFATRVHADDAQGVQRMYVLYCGESDTKDVSVWSPGVDVGKPREFSDSCYLIHHDKGWLLWESGISDAVADEPDGVVAGGGILTLHVRKTLQSQLHELAIAPDDIKFLGFSHFHGDHVGNANLFTGGHAVHPAGGIRRRVRPRACKVRFQSGALRQTT